MWVIDYLGLNKYYENAIKLNDFDTLFTKPIKEIEKIITGLSTGQKKSVTYKAKQLVINGKIDSLKTIETLEKLLGTELIEK